jgi:hypothetical protein
MWANWGALKDFRFVQPVTYLREYFGARLAFIFAWNGLHCKALVVLVMISLLWLLVIEFWNRVIGSDFISHRQVIGFCIVISIWSKITNNMWKREEGFFEELWGLRGTETESSDIIRPDFQGELEPSPVNANIMEKQYSPYKSRIRHAITAGVTFLFCAFVLGVILTWRAMFTGRMGLVSSALLALIIKFFSVVFEMVAPILVNFENHKYQADYFDSYVWKLFLFDYVNNYSAFFFLTVTRAECPPNASDYECNGIMGASLAGLSDARRARPL